MAMKTFCVVLAFAAAAGCGRKAVLSPTSASGYVEATDVRVAAKVAGRVESVAVSEGQRVTAGQVLVTLATTETDLAMARVQADRAQAVAQLRLLQAGSRAEDIRQAEAQAAAAESDKRAADADLAAAKVDEARFEQLIAANSGSKKQRDDAVARRQLAEARQRAAIDRSLAAAAQVARVKAGARPEELDAARARVAAADAQIAALENDRKEAVIVAPSAGTVTSRLVEPGELAAPRSPLIVIVDLDHAWANVYVGEPLVPSLRVDGAVSITTDGGDVLSGRIAYISPQAEFTPRNVQTADERAKLVYRVKVTVDNAKGVLKPGMSVTADFGAPAGK
ncbi:MAG: HlyD family efflux transporter periplasmic adaptor subunit [Acidobacteria bacterium]|nr:MAG: HlyD family efflux transporter periplasmic adaptor subunit [Acidobacteriota bacterium]